MALTRKEKARRIIIMLHYAGHELRDNLGVFTHSSIKESDIIIVDGEEVLKWLQ